VLVFARIACARQLSNLYRLRNKKDVIILGNGPSLKSVITEHLQELQNKDADLVAVNYFCLSSYFMLFKPSMYIFVDPVLYRNANGSQEKKKKGLVEVFSKINWEMYFFIPYSAKNSSVINSVSTNPFIKIVYLNLVPVNAFFCIERFLFKKNLGSPCAMNVLNAAINIMINMRYQNIYLLGADHSWLKQFYINNNNEIIVGDEHFFGNTEVIKIPVKFSRWLKTLSNAFESHDKLQRYANSCNVNIYNSTDGSFIDAYPRKNLFEN
jgi:hypothetical protein